MKDKIALVMGGGAGTGRATVLAFAKEGAKVVIADVNEKSGRETLALLEAQGGEGLFAIADMGRAADVQAVIEQTRQTFGGLHMVSNNAALGAPNKPVTELTGGGVGPLHGGHAARCVAVHEIPAAADRSVRRRCHCECRLRVRIAGVPVGLHRCQGRRYRLSKTVAVEYAKRGIRVNTVCPGVTPAAWLST